LEQCLDASDHLRLQQNPCYATLRERIEASVEAGRRQVKEQYEGWIAADPFRVEWRVVITVPQGFELAVLFALDEDPAAITQRVRETIDE